MQLGPKQVCIVMFEVHATLAHAQSARTTRGSIHLPYTRGGTSVLLFCVKNNALLQSLSSFDSFRSTTNCKAFSSSVHFLLHGPGPSSFPFRWRCWAARRRRRPATAWTGRGCGCQQHPYRVTVVLFGLSSTNLANFDH